MTTTPDNFAETTEHKAAMLAFALLSAATELAEMAPKELELLRQETETLAQTHHVLSQLLQVLFRSHSHRSAAA